MESSISYFSPVKKILPLDTNSALASFSLCFYETKMLHFWNIYFLFNLRVPVYFKKAIYFIRLINF